MSGFILGAKSDQTQTFDTTGVRIPTTFINTSNCYLLDVKTPEKNKYFALRLGFGQTKNIKNPVNGEIKKAGVKTPLRFLREFRLEEYGNDIKIIEEDKKVGVQFGDVKIFVGDEVKPSAIFKIGELVTVSGISKGKGFQGGVKRHHFKGGPRTHGQSRGERAPGSIGMTTTPGRVFRGKRMAGRMGNDRTTIKNLKIIEIKDDGIVIKGLVPGYKGALIEVRN